jgi:tetratricopeptide (TPR) repeat protein
MSSPAQPFSRAQLLRSVAPLAAELPRLIVLVALVTVAFFGTRAVAAHEREQQVQDAAEWHSRGLEALRDGRGGDAITALRRAATKDRANRTYSLALASALATEGQYDAAARVLVALRDEAPDDAQVNLDLARVAVGQKDLTSAERYYRSALYAPWPDLADRLAVRIELSEFLLDQHQAARALPELIAAVADIPDDLPMQLKVAGLLRRAGDSRRALDVYRTALQEAPGNPEALAGAGGAAFALGQYAVALRYLNDAPDNPTVREERSLATLVLARDPLAARLGASERRRRDATNLETITTRLTACIMQHGNDGVDVQGLQAALADVTAAAKARSADRDVLEDNLAIVARAERMRAQSCESDLVDRALLIIADMHGDGS